MHLIFLFRYVVRSRGSSSPACLKYCKYHWYTNMITFSNIVARLPKIVGGKIIISSNLEQSPRLLHDHLLYDQKLREKAGSHGNQESHYPPLLKCRLRLPQRDPPMYPGIPRTLHHSRTFAQIFRLSPLVNQHASLPQGSHALPSLPWNITDRWMKVMMNSTW